MATQQNAHLGQVRVMHSIPRNRPSYEQMIHQSRTYWTIENNTLGEAPIVTVDEMGEDKFPDISHEPERWTQRRVVRKGYNTTK